MIPCYVIIFLTSQKCILNVSLPNLFMNIFLHSASPSVALQDGDTPLMRAVRNRHELIVRMLLDKGAKVHAYDKVRWVGTGVCL